LRVERRVLHRHGAAGRKRMRSALKAGDFTLEFAERTESVEGRYISRVL
jgi:hypothetical protein